MKSLADTISQATVSWSRSAGAIPPITSSSPPPSLSCKPVTPLRHRPGVTFFFLFLPSSAFYLPWVLWILLFESNKHAASREKSILLRSSLPAFIYSHLLHFLLLLPSVSRSAFLFLPLFKIITFGYGDSKCRPSCKVFLRSYVLSCSEKGGKEVSVGPLWSETQPAPPTHSLATLSALPPQANVLH